MANPTGATWSDPPQNPLPQIDNVRHAFILSGVNNNKPLFWIDVPPMVQRIDYAKHFCPGQWTDQAWAMKDGKRATIPDSESWTQAGDQFADETQTDGNIPPIEQLELEYSI